MRRRALLGSVAYAGAVSMAGCLGPDRSLEPPIVNDPRIEDEWREIDRSSGVAFDRMDSPIGISAVEHTIVYEYVPLTEMVDEYIQDVDAPACVLFATRLDVSPSIDEFPGGVGRDRLMSRIDRTGNEQFERRLRRNDITEIERDGEEPFQSETGHDGTLTRYSGSMSVPEAEITLGDQRLALDLGTLAVEARFASWHNGTDALFAGSAYPADAITDVVEGALPGFVTIAFDLDVAYEPDSFEEVVTGLMRSVE